MNPQEQFCPNMECEARGKVGAGNIGNHSHQERRYKCHKCGKTFVETKGTSFYWLKKSKDMFVIVTTLLSHGCPIQAIVVAFGLDERTVKAWLVKAGGHCHKVHEQLVEGHRQELGHIQADEINAKLQGMSVWLAMAVQVETRLWLGAVLARERSNSLLEKLFISLKKMALCRAMVFAVDGFRGYPTVINKVFRVALRTGKKGRPKLQRWPNINIVQVIKRRQEGKLCVERTIFQGVQDKVMAIIHHSQAGKGGINTSYIERLNATFRDRISALARRSRHLYRDRHSLDASVYLLGCVYNFCTPHQSLRRKLFIDALGRKFRYIKRTPAMAAAITQHIWTLEELLTYKLAPPLFIPPKKRGRPKKSLPQRLH